MSSTYNILRWLTLPSLSSSPPISGRYVFHALAQQWLRYGPDKSVSSSEQQGDVIQTPAESAQAILALADLLETQKEIL